MHIDEPFNDGIQIYNSISSTDRRVGQSRYTLCNYNAESSCKLYSFRESESAHLTACWMGLQLSVQWRIVLPNHLAWKTWRPDWI